MKDDRNLDEAKLLVDSCPSTESLRLLESIETPKGPHTGSVLATLDGPVMDYMHPTRNERLYEEELCDLIHDSEYIAELISTNNFLGEPDHPMQVENRLDVHYPYVSHAIRNFRKVPEKGCYYATFDILDTPNGRILKTLIDYGVKLGVSSRGSGRTITKNGRVVVDARTYRFITFDIVHMPGNKVARLPNGTNPMSNRIVTNESTQTLTEQVDYLINHKDINQLKSVLPVLNFLGESQDMRDLINRVEDSIDSINESNTITDFGTNDLVEAYSRIKSLRSTLNSKNSLIESLNDQIEDLKESCENLQDTNSELNEKLNKSIEKAKTHLSRERESRRKLRLMESELNEALNKNPSLVDSLSSNDNYSVNDANYSISALQESLQLGNDAIQENMILKKKINSQDSDLQSLTEQVNYLEDKCNELTSKYFSVRCKQLGLKESVILKSLGGDISGYSFDEIDSHLHESFLAKPKARIATPILESMNQTAKVSTKLNNKSNLSSNSITDMCRVVRSL